MSFVDCVEMAVFLEEFMQNKYRNCMSKRDMCAAKARQALQVKDVYMFRFWGNASRAFEARALDGSLKDRNDRLFTQLKEAKNAYVQDGE